MLFDLRGKRKRVIQVAYAALALLFAVSFVGFGIGSDAAGGIFDALGLGGSSGQSGDPQYQEEIEDAEARLAENPKDEQALVVLVEAHYNSGQFELQEAGGETVPESAIEQYREAADAWERYLELEPKRISQSAAGLMSNAYFFLVQSEGDLFQVQDDLEGYAAATAAVATDIPSANTYADAARVAYLAGDVQAGDDFSQQALKRASGAEKSELERFLDQAERTGGDVQKQLAAEKKQQGEAEPFQNPLQGLESGAPTTAP